MRPTIVTVTGQKGGCGRTTLSASLASLLAQGGKRALLVDLDTQSSAAIALGADPLQCTAAPWLDGETAAFQEPQPGLQILAGGPNLQTVRRLDRARLLERVQGIAAETVLFDNAPAPSDLARASIAAADVVLVVTEPHPLGLSGAAAILAGLAPSQRRALVLSRVDLRRALHREITEGAPAAFPTTPVFVVRLDAYLERAVAMGRPAATGRWSRALDDIVAISTWIFGTGGN